MKPEHARHWTAPYHPPNTVLVPVPTNPKSYPRVHVHTRDDDNQATGCVHTIRPMTERDFVEFFSAQSPDVQSRLRSAFLVPPDVDEMRELRNRVRNLEATLCDITNAAKRALT